MPLISETVRCWLVLASGAELQKSEGSRRRSLQPQSWVWKSSGGRQRRFASCRNRDSGKSNQLTSPAPRKGGGPGPWGPHRAALEGALPPVLTGLRGLTRRGRLGSNGSHPGRGNIVKYVFKLVAMEIRFKDSCYYQGNLTGCDGPSGFDLTS